MKLSIFILLISSVVSANVVNSNISEEELLIPFKTKDKKVFCRSVISEKYESEDVVENSFYYLCELTKYRYESAQHDRFCHIGVHVYDNKETTTEFINSPQVMGININIFSFKETKSSPSKRIPFANEVLLNTLYFKEAINFTSAEELASSSKQEAIGYIEKYCGMDDLKLKNLNKQMDIGLSVGINYTLSHLADENTVLHNHVEVGGKGYEVIRGDKKHIFEKAKEATEFINEIKQDLLNQ